MKYVKIFIYGGKTMQKMNEESMKKANGGVIICPYCKRKFYFVQYLLGVDSKHIKSCRLAWEGEHA